MAGIDLYMVSGTSPSVWESEPADGARDEIDAGTVPTVRPADRVGALVAALSGCMDAEEPDVGRGVEVGRGEEVGDGRSDGVRQRLAMLGLAFWS